MSLETPFSPDMSEAPRTSSMAERAKRHLGLGVSSGLRASAQPYPIYVEHGSGARFVDVDGREFIDHCLAWGPLMLGHAHPEIVDSVTAQLKRGFTYGAQCELEILVAEQICRLVPCAERVLFSNTGTEAVQAALRIARSFTGRRKVVKFEGHYHGWADSVLVSFRPGLKDAGVRERPNTVPTSGGQALSAYSDTVVLPWNDAGAVEAYLSEEGDSVAAVILEPILCNTGCITPEPGYLAALRSLTERFGVVLIFDEVITGFRVALGGAQQLYGVIPDLAIFGKAIAGGFTFSAIAGKDEIIREVDRGRVIHAGTFNGNPVVLSAALATMRVFEREDGAALRAAENYGRIIMDAIERLAEKEGLPLAVLGHGAVFRPIIRPPAPCKDYRDFLKADAAASQTLVVELFRRGVYCVPDGRWYVSAVHGEAEREFILAALPGAIETVAQAYHAAAATE